MLSVMEFRLLFLLVYFRPYHAERLRSGNAEMCQQEILDQSRFYTCVGFGSGIFSIVYVFYMKQTAVCFYDVFKIYTG